MVAEILHYNYTGKIGSARITKYHSSGGQRQKRQQRWPVGVTQTLKY